MRVTIKDIAEELGISHSTVSRVLNDKQSNLVSHSTRDRILQAATRMGYRPSRIAQALQGKATRLIGILVPDEEDYFFQRTIRNIRSTVEQSNYELIVFASVKTLTAETWSRMLQWDLDGIFVFDYLFYVDGLWEALTKHTGQVPPIVGLFSQNTQLRDFVTVDFRCALEELLENLRQQGRRSFAYMAPPDSFSPAEGRYAAFSDFLQRHTLKAVNLPLPEAPVLMEAGRRCVQEYLAQGNALPDALFCQNDEICMGAYRALREASIAIPEQIALAGCDDIPYTSYLETPLTTLTLPIPEVCRQAWRILQDRMAEPEGPPLQVRLNATLHLRESSQRK